MIIQCGGSGLWAQKTYWHMKSERRDRSAAATVTSIKTQIRNSAYCMLASLLPSKNEFWNGMARLRVMADNSRAQQLHNTRSPTAKRTTYIA